MIALQYYGINRQLIIPIITFGGHSHYNTENIVVSTFALSSACMDWILFPPIHTPGLNVTLFIVYKLLNKLVLTFMFVLPDDSAMRTTKKCMCYLLLFLFATTYLVALSKMSENGTQNVWWSHFTSRYKYKSKS